MGATKARLVGRLAELLGVATALLLGIYMYRPDNLRQFAVLGVVCAIATVGAAILAGQLRLGHKIDAHDAAIKMAGERLGGEAESYLRRRED